MSDTDVSILPRASKRTGTTIALNQMLRETGLHAAANIFLLPITSQGNPSFPAKGSETPHQFAAIPIGQTDVAHQQITFAELFLGLGQVLRGLDPITGAAQNAGEGRQCVGVVLHYEQTRFLCLVTRTGLR